MRAKDSQPSTEDGATVMGPLRRLLVMSVGGFGAGGGVVGMVGVGPATATAATAGAATAGTAAGVDRVSRWPRTMVRARR